jgi:hypothetical protein
MIYHCSLPLQSLITDHDRTGAGELKSDGVDPSAPVVSVFLIYGGLGPPFVFVFFLSLFQ